MTPEELALAVTAGITVGYQALFFFVAAAFRFDKVTDFAGGTNFAVLAIVTLVMFGDYHPRQIIVTVLLCIWALRLALFLFARILRWGKDRRFDDRRDNLVKFAIFWVFQAVWAFTCSLPVTFTNAARHRADSSFAAVDFVGWALFALGFILEFIADLQKLQHHSTGHWCHVGLWRWSRHPNYFGEIVLWWGLWLSAFNALNLEFCLISLLSPALIMLLLLFVSGIPLLERSADAKYLGDKGTSQEYSDYKKSTSPLVPLPPQVYSRLPQIAKAVLLFEWPMYNPGAEVGNLLSDGNK